MPTKENFISEIEKLLKTNTINDEAIEFFEMFKAGTIKNSKIITSKGIEILKFLQSKPNDYVFTSKMLSTAIESMNTRSISGTLRKMLNDGFVEKVGSTTPISYKITAMGMAFDLDNIENK